MSTNTSVILQTSDYGPSNLKGTYETDSHLVVCHRGFLSLFGFRASRETSIPVGLERSRHDHQQSGGSGAHLRIPLWSLCSGSTDRLLLGCEVRHVSRSLRPYSLSPRT